MIRNRTLSATAVAVAVTAAALALGACSKASDSSTSSGGTTSNGAPAFPPPADTQAAVKAAGLTMLPSEGTTVHYHTHLDVNINGKAVTVPALVGIGQTSISELHTHDTTGVVHIEAVSQRPFTLQQFMTEWGVKLDQNCFATYCTDATNELRVFVDGQRVTDPTTVQLKPETDTTWQEILIWYGPRTTNPSVPSSYSPAPAPIAQ